MVATQGSNMNDEWGTPDWVFQLAHKIEPTFSFDAACNDTNCLINYQTMFGDLLKVDWNYETFAGNLAVWCNPPYSRGKINAFIDKGLDEAREKGTRSVFLVRHDPTAKWFQKAFNSGYVDVYMIGKRIKFKGADNTYPFPNCFLHFKAKDNNGWVGYIPL